jgi:hypothetical protein
METNPEKQRQHFYCDQSDFRRQHRKPGPGAFREGSSNDRVHALRHRPRSACAEFDGGKAQAWMALEDTSEDQRLDEACGAMWMFIIR